MSADVPPDAVPPPEAFPPPPEPGDHDALPHLPATDPATIPPDEGDPGAP